MLRQTQQGVISGGILVVERDDGSLIFEEEPEVCNPGSPILQSRPVAVMGDVRRIVLWIVYTGICVAFLPVILPMIYFWFLPSERVETPDGIAILKAIPVLASILILVLVLRKSLLGRNQGR